MRVIPSCGTSEVSRVSHARNSSWQAADELASIALKVVVMLPPEKFRHAFYSQFVFMGLLLPIIPFVPESVCKYPLRSVFQVHTANSH